MTAAPVTENLSLLASAPGGVQKLRSLVIELAIQGRLVPQDGNAESADVLLSAISKARAEFYEASPVRPAKVQAIVGSDEQPSALPNGWRWARLGWLAHPQAGFAFKSAGFNQDSRGLPLVRIRDVGQSFSGTFFEGDYRPEFVVDDGDYLISMDGEFRIARWYAGKALLNQRVSRLLFFSRALRSEFVAFALQARLRELQGAKAYTTVDHLSGGQIADCVIALPPLEEQHRIVAKVDELMALCDRLEAEHADAEATHAKLVEALLATLIQARDAADFRASWQQLAKHLHTLFTTEASVDALKQTVLQLGVMGKLAAQNPMDEPARKLLERLARDRRESAAQLRFTDTKLSCPSHSEPFELPSGWEWTTLASLFRVITDGDHQAPPRAEHGVAFLTIGNISAGRLDFDGCRQVETTYFEALPAYRKPGLGDLLYTVVGATYGRPVLVDSDRPFCVQRHIAILKRSEHLSERFALYLLKSPLVYKQASNCVTGTAQPTIPLRPLRSINVPLPPLDEQRRIVAKVDELLSLCDQLKLKLAQARQHHEHLASVLVEEAAA